MQYLRFMALLALVVLMSACLAPEDLDMTPTVPPTELPPTREANVPAPTEEVAASGISAETQARLDALIAAVPTQVSAGAIQWNRVRANDATTAHDDTVPLIVEREGGVTGKISFDERGGGASDITFGVFDTPELALAFYETTKGNLRTLEQSEERDQFPTPNAFGGGTYGSDAIFVIDNTFIRISVPRFSSTAGDPLNPYTRALLAALTTAGLITVPE